MAVQSGFLLVLHVLIVVTFGATGAWAESCLPLSEYRRAVLTAEHLFGGKPSSGDILVRRGYVTEYDAVRRVPRWAAWRAAPAYLHAPTRSGRWSRSEEHTSELQSLMRISYAVFCLKKKTNTNMIHKDNT